MKNSNESMKSRKFFQLLTIGLLFIYKSIYGYSFGQDAFLFDSFQPGYNNESVTDVFKDSKGFLWVGTTVGLYLFDGYEFTSFTSKPNEKNSISDNNIVCITEDYDGFIWVGTMDGLNRYDRITNTFTRYYAKSGSRNSLISNSVRCLIVDSENYIWVGNNGGVVSINPSRDIYKHYLTDVKIKGQSEVLQSHCIIEKDKNTFWIGSWNHGLIELNKKSGRYRMFLHNNSDKQSIADNNIFSFFYEKPNGRLWIGLFNSTISVFDTQTERFRNIELPIKTVNKQDAASVNTIIRNIDDKIWIGTDKGLYLFDEKKMTFSPINLNNRLTLPGLSTVKKILPDENGNVWIGADKLYLFNPQKNRFSSYRRVLPKENPGIIQNYVKTFLQDVDGNLWIGTFSDGILLISPGGKTERIFLNNRIRRIHSISVYNNEEVLVSTDEGLFFVNTNSKSVVNQISSVSGNPRSLFDKRVQRAFRDSKGNLWIITQESIEMVNLKTNQFIHFTKDNPNGISYYKGTDIEEDKYGNIWIGTFNGLNKFDYKSGSFTHYLNSPEDDSSISKSYINDIVCTIKGDLWISTTKGLNRFNYQNETFTRYYESDGFSSDQMGRMTIDQAGNLWISSNIGLSRFTPSDKRVVNFDSKDGLDPNPESIYIDNKGIVYIGGRHFDYYQFNPVSIPENKKTPPVYITDFKLFNKSIKSTNEANMLKLSSDLFGNGRIKLNYKQSSFTLVFSALNYTNGEKNNYKYKLEGFDSDWISAGSKAHEAAYTNLNPAKYRFRVIASNNDGYWNEEGATVLIEILPPFWLSWYAYVFYVLLIAGILIYLRNSIIKRETERNRIENEKNEATRVHEMDLMKLRFFANISHELRTPLTLILGPVDRILKSLFSGIQPEVIQQQLALVYRNSLRMEHLITEIMDTFKIESGTVKLRIQETDFVKFIKEIAQVFDSIANEKKLKFTVDSPEKTVPVWIDNEKIEKVLYNLLSNAFKFTESGEVKVTIQYIFEGNESYPAGYVAVRVTDTGCGMDENEAQEVFKRFFQANNQSKSGQAGTGLGMALTKELVELHKGIITVKSELNKGTEYEFRLHLGNEQLSADEIAGENEKYDNRNIQTIQMLANAELDLQKVEEEVQSRKKLPLLLIVEDNKDLVVYLKSMLNEKYRIEVAYNGKNGWLLAQELLPDLILSDVMMPEMDGFEMTKLIKTNAATCHIPVLLLTARDADNYRIEGLETGAFDYMVKPFNAEVLNLKIRNIQKNQEDLRRFYAESWKNPAVDRSEFVATDVHIPSSDNSFLEKIKNFLQDNIKNSSFTVDMLAAHLNMSVRNMNRKINSLLNSSALELMTEMRLNKAKVLFEESDLNVAEISFQCGFIDSNYFGKCFKRFTGLSPKEYRANQKKSNTELQ